MRMVRASACNVARLTLEEDVRDEEHRDDDTVSVGSDVQHLIH